jgi:hypothetical protein
VWYYLVHFHGANTAFGPMINCFIHLLMYGYYGFTGVGIRLDFIKMIMTSAQMVQFVVILVHSVFHLSRPNAHWPLLLAGVQTLLMIQCVGPAARGAASALSTPPLPPPLAPQDAVHVWQLFQERVHGRQGQEEGDQDKVIHHPLNSIDFS